MANALLAKWEQNAKHRAVNRLFESATSSEPGANGPGVFPQPDVGPGGGLDYAQYNQSVPTKSMEEAVGEVVKGAKAEGRDTPNVVELLKLAAMVPSGIVQGLVNTAIMGGTAGKRAATGEMQVMDPATGHSSEDAIQSALALTGLISSGSFAGAPEGALASGATRRPMPVEKPMKDWPEGPSFTPAETRYLDLAGMDYNKRVRQGVQEEFEGMADGADAKSAHAKINARNAGSAGERAKADTLYQNGSLTDAEYEAMLEHVEKGGRVDPARVHQSNAEVQGVLDEQIKANPNFLDEQAAALRKAVQESADDNPDFAPPPKGPALNAGSKEAAGVADVLGNAAKQPPWYSHAARVVDQLPTTKAPASQWLATLKNKGVKDEELEALNLPTGDRPITKDELKATIEFNTPQINEVIKKGELQPGDGVFEATRAAIADTYGEPIETVTDEAVRDAIAEHEGGTDDVDNKGITKYSQYQLPGGENYREILVTTPAQGKHWRLTEFHALDKSGQPVVYPQADFATRSEAEAAAKTRQNQQLTELRGIDEGGDYRSSHWDEPNVLGHIRVNDRQIPDDVGRFVAKSSTGEEKRFSSIKEAYDWTDNQSGDWSLADQPDLKTLHAEELQSDWHQQGKKQGYNVALKASDYVADKLSPESTVWNVRDKDGNFVYQTGAAKTADGAIQEAIAQAGRDAKADAYGKKVPDAPFKKSWPDLLLRRLVKRAVDEGYDAISWTGGEAQAERYDLSKQLDHIQYIKKPDGTVWIHAIGTNGRGVLEKTVKPEELPAIIGKDVTDRIMADDGALSKGNAAATHDSIRDRGAPTGAVQQGNSWYITFKTGYKLGTYPSEESALREAMRIEQMVKESPIRELRGDDLKVGGEGMKAFYDQELPRRAKKLFGGQVEKKEISGGKAPELDTQDATDEFDGRVFMAMEDWRTAHPHATDEEEQAAEDAFADKFMHTGGATIHVMRLTPEIKAKVKAGQPLFSTGVPLDASNDQNTKRVIRLVRVPHDPFEGEKK